MTKLADFTATLAGLETEIYAINTFVYPALIPPQYDYTYTPYVPSLNLPPFTINDSAEVFFKTLQDQKQTYGVLYPPR